MDARERVAAQRSSRYSRQKYEVSADSGQRLNGMQRALRFAATRSPRPVGKQTSGAKRQSHFGAGIMIAGADDRDDRVPSEAAPTRATGANDRAVHDATRVTDEVERRHLRPPQPKQKNLRGTELDAEGRCAILWERTAAVISSLPELAVRWIRSTERPASMAARIPKPTAYSDCTAGKGLHQASTSVWNGGALVAYAPYSLRHDVAV